MAVSTPTVQPFPERLRALCKERGLSVSRASYLAYDPAVKGTSPNTLNSVMAGRREPTIPLMEALARVLGTTPDVFVEYGLAVARHLFDPREVGLEQAAANLAACEDVRRLIDVYTARRPTAAEREAAREREAAALRERAQQRHARREDEPGTKPAPPRRRRRAG